MQRDNSWQVLTSAGAAAFQGGQYRQAHQMFRAAVSDAEKRNHSMQLATSLHNLALIYKKQRRYRKAFSLLTKSLEMAQQDIGRENTFVSSLHDKLAELIVNEDPVRAIALLERAHEIDLKSGGSYHCHMPSRLIKIAFLYSQQGKMGKACSLYKESCEMFVFGKDYKQFAGEFDCGPEEDEVGATNSVPADAIDFCPNKQAGCLNDHHASAEPTPV